MKAMIRMGIALCCLSMMAVGVTAGCSKKVEEVTKPAPVGQKARRTVKRKKKSVAKEKVLDDQSRYDAYLRVKKKDLDGRVVELKQSLRRATGRSRARLKRQLRDLERKKRDIDDAHRQYKSAKGAGKTQARAELDRTIKEFDDNSTVTTEEL